MFASRYRRERKAVSRDALRKLCAYGWPGNVRQLEHVLLSAWLMSERAEIAADDIELPSPAPSSGRRAPGAAGVGERRSRPAAAPPAGGRPASETEFKAAERERILSALAACNWNRVQAARMIGLPRRTFYRRLKEFGILAGR
jgi:serine/threonine-protein kinase PknK